MPVVIATPVFVAVLHASLPGLVRSTVRESGSGVLPKLSRYYERQSLVRCTEPQAERSSASCTPRSTAANSLRYYGPHGTPRSAEGLVAQETKLKRATSTTRQLNASVRRSHRDVAAARASQGPGRRRERGTLPVRRGSFGGGQLAAKLKAGAGRRLGWTKAPSTPSAPPARWASMGGGQFAAKLIGRMSCASSSRRFDQRALPRQRSHLNDSFDNQTERSRPQRVQRASGRHTIKDTPLPRPSVLPRPSTLVTSQADKLSRTTPMDDTVDGSAAPSEQSQRSFRCLFTSARRLAVKV